MCAACESVVSWNWLDRNPGVASSLLAAERRRDPEGFAEFCAGVVVAKIEYWNVQGGRPMAARRPRRGNAVPGRAAANPVDRESQ